MSWSFGVKLGRPAGEPWDDDLLASTTWAAFNGEPGGAEFSPRAGQAQNGTESEAAEQVQVAITAAQAILDGLGPNAVEVNVNMSGHANPHHEKTEGWSNDMTTVGLSVAEYAAIAAPDGPVGEANEAS